MASILLLRARQLFTFVILLLLTLVYSEEACPLQTPLYPPPRDLLSSSDVKMASQNLTQAIEAAMASGMTDLGPLTINTTTFGVKVFSAHTSESVYEHLYTSPTYRPASGSGTKYSTLDSIYRVSSISKMLTVLTLLAHDGFTHWHHPIINFIPELDSLAHKRSSRIQWREITVGDLAAQLGGMPHDYGFEDLAGEYSNAEMMAMGLPSVPSEDVPSCSQGESLNQANPCDREAFIFGLVKEHLTFPPGMAPAYSNAAYQLLRYVMENITGLDFPSMFQNNPNFGIIPVNETVSVWNFDLGDGDAFGGVYSSPNDLVLIGRAILQTLSGSSPHTTSFKTSVGAPWEIYRYELPNRSNHAIDIYAKAGNLGAYSDIIVLVPEWEVGFVITAADLPTNPLPNVYALADLIIDRLFPAFDKAAQKEANRAFAGTYRAPEVSWTVKITTDHYKPGLQVTEWVSNGVDFFQSLRALSGLQGLAVRLYPTGIEEKVDGEAEKNVYFRSVFDYSVSVRPKGVISSTCQSWLSVDGSKVGNIGVDEWAFSIKEGQAHSVRPRVLRKELYRT
ncbi:hypothetical protein ETB97_004880 [Aspergillus alliaceus]|uniref:Beta-lactamase-related domain-containing protein n=1 Tax=Petromyces alliaceus TaxID=209559 RepID=A0A8H5ZZF5_PETAA|nr:hypothetical protein ETB97_004880 [Aspergillus burnettii]